MAVRGGCSVPTGCRGSEGLRGRLLLAGGSGLSWSLARGSRSCPLLPAELPPTPARGPGRGAPCRPGGGASVGGSSGPGGACGWLPPWADPSGVVSRSNSSANLAKSLVPNRQRSILAPDVVSCACCSFASVLHAWDKAVWVMAGIWRAKGPAYMPPEIGSILKCGLADRANSDSTLRYAVVSLPTASAPEPLLPVRFGAAT